MISGPFERRKISDFPNIAGNLLENELRLKQYKRKFVFTYKAGLGKQRSCKVNLLRRLMAVPLHALLFNGSRLSFDFTVYCVSFH